MGDLNINNLTLEDNTFKVLPDGDYHFTVMGHEVGYATSEKLPPNTQQIKCELSIPILEDDEITTVTVRNNLNVYKKALFAIRQFVEAIGMVPERGKASIDLEKIDGLSGVCAVSVYESASGNKYNRVERFYPPSKVPAVTANDEAWDRKGTYLEVPDDDDDIPFL